MTDQGLSRKNLYKVITGFSKRGDKIPEHKWAQVVEYIVGHAPAWPFLRAVIENDLKSACAYASDDDLRIMHVYSSFFYAEAPSNCWGSPRAYLNWLADSPETAAKKEGNDRDENKVRLHRDPERAG